MARQKIVISNRTRGGKGGFTIRKDIYMSCDDPDCYGMIIQGPNQSYTEHDDHEAHLQAHITALSLLLGRHRVEEKKLVAELRKTRLCASAPQIFHSGLLDEDTASSTASNDEKVDRLMWLRDRIAETDETLRYLKFEMQNAEK